VKLGGGGPVWVSTSYDPDLNLMYFGVGNGSVWNQHYRSASKGDNFKSAWRGLPHARAGARESCADFRAGVWDFNPKPE
jgi:alcohol dehydrogenase (cytochrome c)/quinohemoprotein ethanol dehydrogenase